MIKESFILVRTIKAGGIWTKPCGYAVFITAVVFKEVYTSVGFVFPLADLADREDLNGLGRNTHVCIHVCKCKQCVIWLHSICYLRLVYVQKAKAGIWDCLAECEYYFSIHAQMHKIKIGKCLYFARQRQEDQSKVNICKVPQ